MDLYNGKSGLSASHLTINLKKPSEDNKFLLSNAINALEEYLWSFAGHLLWP
jgi:hypothetical protein